MTDKVLAIIPAFNEEENIARVITGIRQSAPGVDILVVDDGGTDNTRRIVREMGERVLCLPFNLGYGAALQAGFRYALSRGYAYAVQIDGDGQHDPVSLPGLLATVQNGEADVAIGSRFLGGAPYRVPLVRRAGMLVFGRLASALTGQRITDPTSGYQALNARAISRFFASAHYPADFPDADVIIMLHRAGLKVVEQPVVMHRSPTRKSMHGGLSPVYYVFKMFLSIFLTLLRKNPF